MYDKDEVINAILDLIKDDFDQIITEGLKEALTRVQESHNYNLK